MGHAALSQAHRLYSFSETILVSFAQANIPYAIEILLLLQFADLLIARTLANFATALPGLARCFAGLDTRPADRTPAAKTSVLKVG